MFEQYRKPRGRRVGAKAGGLLLAGALTAAASVLAAETPPAATPPSNGQCNCRGGDIDLAKMDERAAKEFAAADTNHDGKISLDEFLAFKPQRGPGGPGGGPHMGMGMMGGGWTGHDHGPDGAPNGDWQKQHDADMQKFQSEMFTALDIDHNGQVSQAEFAKAPEVMHTLMKKQMFAKMDTNHDGFIEKDEFMARMDKMSALDTNGDGNVSRDEMKAAHDAKRAQNSSSAPSN